MSSEYDVRSKGKLKLKGTVLKGTVAEGGIRKKKKSKAKAKSQEEGDASTNNDRDPVKALERAIDDDAAKETASRSGRSSPVGASSSDRKTDAEKRFEQVQKKRLEDKVKKLAHMSHKDRVHEFNTRLEALSEHHDIPKVGPG